VATSIDDDGRMKRVVFSTYQRASEWVDDAGAGTVEIFAVDQPELSDDERTELFNKHKRD